eukprot:1205210-Amphidinium_carterae.1
MLGIVEAVSPIDVAFIAKIRCWYRFAFSMLLGHAQTVNGHVMSHLANVAILAHKPSNYCLTDEDPLKRPTYRAILPDPTVVAAPAGEPLVRPGSCTLHQ